MNLSREEIADLIAYMHTLAPLLSRNRRRRRRIITSRQRADRAAAGRIITASADVLVDELAEAFVSKRKRPAQGGPFPIRKS